MLFKDWVRRNGGLPAVARKLKVNESTVFRWMTGERRPRASYLRKIQRASKGKVDVIASFLPEISK